jgi:hypothetical protein
VHNPVRPVDLGDANANIAQRVLNRYAPGLPILQNTGVVAGSYSAADITVGADGRVTFAVSGSGSTSLTRGLAIDLPNLPVFY